MHTWKHYGFQDFNGVKITDIDEATLRVRPPGIVRSTGMAFENPLAQY
jgi:hypothetical protein